MRTKSSVTCRSWVSSVGPITLPLMIITGRKGAPHCAFSAAAVWAATTDIARFAELLSGVEKIEIVERPATGLIGLKWKETRILFGKPATAEKWITEAAENEFYETRAESDGFVFLSTMRIFESSGGVTVTSTHVSVPQTLGAKLMSIPMKLLFKGVAKKALLQDLRDLKSAVEQQSSAAA